MDLADKQDGIFTVYDELCFYYKNNFMPKYKLMLNIIKNNK